jgi:hypothetical protein
MSLESTKSILNRKRDRASAAILTLARKSLTNVFKTVMNLLGGIYLIRDEQFGLKVFAGPALRYEHIPI